jgi:hypothetical protein
MHNRLSGPGRESAGLIVASKRGNARGAKGPCQIRASAGGGENRLDANSTTDRRCLPEELSLLRQKLNRKAKQGANDPSGHRREPIGIGFWPNWDWSRCSWIVNSLRMPAANVSGNAGCGKSARPV